MNPQKLFIRGVRKDIGQSLSALVPVGADFWLGADEGTSLARANAAGEEWSAIGSTDLLPTLDLPAKTPKPKKKPDDEDEFPEVDAEGMDFDGRHLWVIGSHSLKRKQPEPDKHDEKNLERLETVEADGNRYLLGRLPLDEQGDLLNPGAATTKHCAARLPCDLAGSALLKALRKDELLARYLHASGGKATKRNVPGKDNGLDIEGLAAIGRDHLLIGLRGPVLRGWALLLELRLTCRKPPADGGPATLRLKKIGKRRYRRLAFELGGLGVRDLCFVENGDLLILAGPTMVLPSPAVVFRWAGAKEKLARDDEDHFVWNADLHDAEELAGDGPEPVIWDSELREVFRYTPGSPDERAEALCILGRGPNRRLVIGYDSKGRWSKEDKTLALDAFPVPEGTR